MTHVSRRRSVVFAAPAVLAAVIFAAGCEDKESDLATSNPNGSAGGGNKAGAGGGANAGASATAGNGGATSAGASGAATGGTAGATGGSAGKASGGSAGTAAGSAGSSAGAAGKAGAGGTAGKAGAGGTAGKAGASGSAGAAGTAGKAGASGAAGGGGSSTLPPIGGSCTADAACGAGNKCLLPTGKDFLGGGPTNGLCVKDCTAAGSTCATGSTCVPFDDKKYCMESCTYGTPPLPDDPIAEVPEGKCHGRLDLSCAPLGGTTKGACVPRCWPSQAGVDAADLCPATTTCDPTKGVCVSAGLPEGLLRNGAACSPNAPARQCLGNCIALDTGGSTGICSEPCSGAVAESCGGLDAGLCFLDTEGITTAATGFVYYGPLDVAGCAMSVGPTEDAKCLWQSGWFPVSFAFPDKTRSYCLPAKSCTGDPDCVETCKEQKDCSHTDAACTAGKCTVSDTCKTVGAEKYCMDHAPTVP